MKRTLLPVVARRLALRALAVVAAVLAMPVAAQTLESDDISAAVLKEGSLPVKWTNDAQHPWFIAEDGDGSYIRTAKYPNNATGDYRTTAISFSYTSEYPVELSGRYRDCCVSGTKSFTIKVDDQKVYDFRSTYWEYHTPVVLPKGTHTVTFSTVVAYSSQDYYWAGIRNLMLTEYRSLETSCLKPGSLPLTFENDPEHPWITRDGYIQSTAHYTVKEKHESKISTTFTIDRTSIFSLESKNGYNGEQNVKMDIFIDGIWHHTVGKDSWSYFGIVLYPGKHTVEIRHWGNSGSGSYWTALRNVRLDQTWYDVNLSLPGTLGTGLLQALQGKNLQDTELLKVSGSLNYKDWETISLLSGIHAVDLSDTDIQDIPVGAFKNLHSLTTVMLPKTLKTIGTNAFESTFFNRITIPASVEKIGQSVWTHTPLRFIDFEDDSKLAYIGAQAFYDTRIIEFKMPDSVTELANQQGYSEYNSQFAACKYLEKVHISEKLKTIPYCCFNDCKVLKEVSIPAGITSIGYAAFAGSGLQSVVIPEGASLGRSAFSRCDSLKHAVLNSHIRNMYSTFYQCYALESVVLPCATPPTRDGNDDPFSNVNKSKVTLTVPDFAIESYRSDPYWCQFTTTKSSDEASVKDYWAVYGNLVLDGAHKMQGTPSVDLQLASTLFAEPTTKQDFNELKWLTDEQTPSNLLSKSNAITAKSLTTRFRVAEKNKWYFITPTVDVKMADIKFSTSDSWVIRRYDGARRASQNANSGNWVNVPADGTLKRGEGYIFQATQAGWITLPAATAADIALFTGSNEATLPLADNACETAANAGWNFVGNPYPCYYDIYYLALQAPITVWTGSTYRAYSLNDGDRGDDTFILRPMQPFFVQKAAEGQTVGFPLVGRQTNTAIDRTRAPRRDALDENRLKLNLEIFVADRDEADDYTRVVVNPDASLGYDPMSDASKFMSLDPEAAQLFSLGDAREPMAINERPYADGNVALGVYLPLSGSDYRISALRADCAAWLYDAATGSEHDLTAADYLFTSLKQGLDTERFSLRLGAANSVSAVVAANVIVAGREGGIAVESPAAVAVEVYSAAGARMASAEVAGSAFIPMEAGIYVVRTAGRSFKTIVR